MSPSGIETLEKLIEKWLKQHADALQEYLDRVRKLPKEQQGAYLALLQQVLGGILSAAALPWPALGTDTSGEYEGAYKYKFGETRKQDEVFEAQQRKRDEESRQKMKREQEVREAEQARDQALWEKRQAEEARDEALRKKREAEQ